MRLLKRSGQPRSVALAEASSDATLASPESAQGSSAREGFLPFTASAADETAYLRQFVEQGGEAAKQYKSASYEMLQLQAGMYVLDVGCGVGSDLQPLAALVGEDGQVTGLDSNDERLREAHQAIGNQSNIHLTPGNAEQMPFSACSFDRVRADRVLLHIPQPRQVIDEMWRVLRPGGLAVMVEPDWKSIAIYPGSPAAGDDDHIWSAAVQVCQRRLAHALIGRQLFSLFLQGGNQPWKDIQIEAKVYILKSWQVTDTILQISQLAQVLIQEDGSLANEVETWLQALEAASRRGEFFASLPLFYARARKEETR